MNGTPLSLFLPLAVSAERSEFAIRRYLETGSLLDPESEVAAIEDVAKFLSDAKFGRELFNEMRLDERVVETSKAYGKALDVIERLLKRNRAEIESMGAELEELLDDYGAILGDFLSQMGGGVAVESKRLRKVEGFLQTLRELLFDELAPISVERVTLPQP